MLQYQNYLAQCSILNNFALLEELRDCGISSTDNYFCSVFADFMAEYQLKEKSMNPKLYKQ